ncbi:type II CAAX endopeptidase family protein [Arenicella sp. 4NH20-0111]|uniref:CPBP family intramembrane glutamic endopeptidase n=1 Tax=Arenicella sp. 4NH20-0111 TaxID=3127648 RepID=UPI00310B7CE4
MMFIWGLEITTWMVVITACLLWIKDDRVWRVSCLLTVFSCLVFGAIEPIALIPIVLIWAACESLKFRSRHRYIGLLFLLIIGVALGLHIIPGFNNHQFLVGYQLSDTSAPFSIWFNYDKSIYGVLVLGVVFHQTLIHDRETLFTTVSLSVPIIIIGLFLVYSIGLLIGYAQIDLTWSSTVWPWALKNLVFTVIAEEVLFRGLIQRELERGFGGSRGGVYAVLIAALLFGVAHSAGGLMYVVLATCAGCVYGYAYLRTRRIEAAIAAHFLLNLVHFMVFSYPYATS